MNLPVSANLSSEFAQHVIKFPGKNGNSSSPSLAEMNRHIK